MGQDIFCRFIIIIEMIIIFELFLLYRVFSSCRSGGSISVLHFHRLPNPFVTVSSFELYSIFKVFFSCASSKNIFSFDKSCGRIIPMGY